MKRSDEDETDELSALESRPAVQSLSGKKVTVIGLGRFGGGVGVTKWLCSQGAKVIVTDKADDDDLADSIKALRGLNVELHLGGHDETDFIKTDLLIVNPAVPRDLPQLKAAFAKGVRWTTEINLFLQRCRAPIVGVTGSVGKSTTTAMIGQILARKFTVHVGGNIGKSLLEELPRIQTGHVVVLELSSFQLEDLPQVGVSPRVAVVTNLIPNHLDRHGTMEAYGNAKKNIFLFQGADDVLVLNRHCPVTSKWAKEAKGKVEFFDADSAERFNLIVPGKHNHANAQAAWVACRQMGSSRADADEALREFAGLKHRLQFVAEHGGVRYYNDSKCTTPQGAIVAIESFKPRKTVILVGGYDKHVSFDSLGAALAKSAKAVVALGDTREAIIAAVEKHSKAGQPTVVRAEDFASAVKAAKGLAQDGDSVLLSPACASYDMFDNYEQRGDKFVELVG